MMFAEGLTPPRFSQHPQGAYSVHESNIFNILTVDT